jgi:hypothetical protein
MHCALDVSQRTPKHALRAGRVAIMFVFRGPREREDPETGRRTPRHALRAGRVAILFVFHKKERVLS